MVQQDDNQDFEPVQTDQRRKQSKIGAMIRKAFEAASDAMANGNPEPVSATDPEIRETVQPAETVPESEEIFPRDPGGDIGEKTDKIQDKEKEKKKAKGKDKKKKKKKEKARSKSGAGAEKAKNKG